MRNKTGQFIKGHSGNPSGRPKRADEQFLIDLWESNGKEVFAKAIKDKQQWAIKCLMDKLFANQKTVENTNITHMQEVDQETKEIVKTAIKGIL